MTHLSFICLLSIKYQKEHVALTYINPQIKWDRSNLHCFLLHVKISCQCKDNAKKAEKVTFLYSEKITVQISLVKRLDKGWNLNLWICVPYTFSFSIATVIKSSAFKMINMLCSLGQRKETESDIYSGITVI